MSDLHIPETEKTILSINDSPSMNISATHQETGRFWDEITGWYGERDEAERVSFLATGGSFLYDNEAQLLGDLSAWCGRAIHLQCSHGDDALSLLKLGAGEVVGVDISERLLDVARRKTAALNAPASWYLADVLQTPDILNGTADLVYTGKGALCWMMDLDAWAAVTARLLKPGGRLFIYEGHPLDWVWDMDAETYVLDKQHGDYFSDKNREQLFGESQATPRYRQWTLAQIINSVISVGLVIEQLHEFPEPFWSQFPNLPDQTLHRLPHTFALFARKP